MSKLADAFVEISARGQNAVFATLNKLGDLLANLAARAKSFANAFNNAMGGLGNAVKNGLAAIPSMLGSAFTSARSAIAGGMASLGNFIAQNWQQMFAGLITGGALGTAILGGMLGSMGTVAVGIGSLIASVVMKFWPDQLAGAFKWSIGKASQGLGAIGNFIGGLFGRGGGGGATGSPLGPGGGQLDRWVRVLPLVVRIARQLEIGIDRIGRAWAHSLRAVRDLQRVFAGVVRLLRLMVDIVQRFLTRLALAYPQIMPILTAWRTAARGSAAEWQRAMNQITAVTNGAVGRIQQAAGLVASAFRMGAAGGGGGAVGILAMLGPYGRAIAAVYAGVTRIAGAFMALGRTALGVVRGIVSTLSTIVSTTYSLGRSIMGVVLSPLRMLWNNLFSIRGLLATIGVTLSAAATGRYIAHWTADAEDAAVSFKVLLGSAGQAKTMLGELQELADKTPLQLPEVRDAAKHLLAMGVQATAVTDTIRRLGDVSQGLGLDLNHVADIYGKVSQANRLTGEDMRRFRLNGIPIARELAIMLGKSTQEIEHMAHTGTLRFADVERVFQRMTNEGGIFFNLMKEKSQTLGGLWSTMQDSMRNLAVYFGQGMAPAVKNIERVMIAFLDNAKAKIWPLRNQFREMAEELSTRLPRILEAVTNSIPYLVEGIRTARAVMAMLRDIAGQVTQKILSWVGGADAAKGGIMDMIKYVRFLANEWELVWAIAKTRMQIFMLDWQNEMVAAFSSLAEKITPALKVIGEVLKDVFREAVFSLINLLVDGFAAVAPKLGKLLLLGAVSPAGAYAMLLKEVHDASADFFNSGTGDTLEGRIKKLLPKTDTKAADEKRKELDELLDKFNAQFKKFIDEDKLKELNDALLKAAEDAEAAGGKEALKNRPGLPSGEPKEKDKYSFHGLTDFWKHFQSGITPNSAVAIAKQSLEEQKKIKKAQDRTNELLGKRMVPAFGK